LLVFLGEKAMRNLVVICAVALNGLGLSGVASAVRPVREGILPIGPFASVAITPSEIDLGMIRFPGLDKSGTPTKLKARIVANCSHYVAVSFGGFTHTHDGDRIPDENVTVMVNGISIPVGGRGIPIVDSLKPTPKEGVEIPVDVEFGLKRWVSYPSGKYRGILAFTVAAKP
jgi:hypothetical protein